MTHTPVSSAAEELRELAERIFWDYDTNVEGDSVDTQDLRDASNAILELAAIKEAAGKGVTEESVDAAVKIIHPEIIPHFTGWLDAKIRVRAALQVVTATMLAANNAQQCHPHKFVSEFGSEFCDVCNHSILGHDS